MTPLRDLLLYPPILSEEDAEHVDRACAQVRALAASMGIPVGEMARAINDFRVRPIFEAEQALGRMDLAVNALAGWDEPRLGVDWGSGSDRTVVIPVPAGQAEAAPTARLPRRTILLSDGGD